MNIFQTSITDIFWLKNIFFKNSLKNFVFTLQINSFAPTKSITIFINTCSDGLNDLQNIGNAMSKSRPIPEGWLVSLIKKFAFKQRTELSRMPNFPVGPDRPQDNLCFPSH